MALLRMLGCLLLAAPLSLQAANPKVSEFKLDNGMKLLVQEDHRAPVAVTQVWYKVGSSYEHGGITGISHMRSEERRVGKECRSRWSPYH